MSKKVAEKGQALIELILAIAIATVLLSVLATGAISAREAFARSDRVLDANTLLQKEIEAVRSIKETGWSFLGTRSVSSTFFITRYYGNSTWVQTTQAHFNAGTHTNTVVNGDQVELTTGSGGNWNSPQVVATRDFSGTV